MNKFKSGDRVVLNDPNWPQYTNAVVARDPENRDGQWYLPVRFDNYDYGTPNNAHSGWEVEMYEYDLIYYSPLGKALA